MEIYSEQIIIMMRNNIKSLFYLFACLCGVFFLFNCAELHFSSWHDCSDKEYKDSEYCEHKGDTDLLIKKPVDVLFVLGNSEKLRKKNILITSNLKKFLKCLEPSDWQVGFIASSDNELSEKGELMPLEFQGQLSNHRFLNADTEDYSILFSHSVSTSSGCNLPPYCAEDPPKPLDVIRAFMSHHHSEAHKAFLRKKASLAIISVSLAAEEDEVDEKDKNKEDGITTAEETLSSVQTGYSGDMDQFIYFTVTAPGTSDDCIETVGDRVSKGIQATANLGTELGLMMSNPLVLIGSTIFGAVTAGFNNDEDEIKKTKSLQMSRLTTMTGGRVLNLCHPAFGQALAYSVLEHIGMEERISSDCQTLKKEKRSKKATGAELEI